MRGERGVIAALIVSVLISAGAFLVAIIGNVSKSNQNADLIRRSAYNDCVFLRGIIFSFHTAQGRKSALLILKYNPQLANCTRYSRNLGSSPKATPRHMGTVHGH